MMKTEKNLLNYPIIIIGFSILFCCITPAMAGFGIEGSKFVATVNPGDFGTHVIKVAIGETDLPLNVTVEVMGMGTGISSSTISIPKIEDLSPYSARSFISIDKSILHLEPNKPQTVTATITIPKNVGAGGRYAMIVLQTPPSKGGTISMATAINVPIVLTIKGTELKKTGSIIDLKVLDPKPGQPLLVVTNFKNTGNYHYNNIINEVKILDTVGNERAFSRTDPSNFAIIPTFSVKFENPISTELPIGSYQIQSTMKLGNDTVLDSKATVFEVKEPYIPPFTEITTKVTPRNPTIITTSGGRVSLNFPAGAVLQDTDITLRPVRVEQASPAPTNQKLGSLLFSIEGITGLLAKDAILTVIYGPEDLNLAGGNPEKLAVARWDPAEGKWILMPTALNKEAKTLTVMTNRLSTWAIMAVEGQVPRPGEVPGATATKTPGFSVGIAIGTLALLFIANRLRRR